jgi:hypothetical protein
MIAERGWTVQCHSSMVSVPCVMVKKTDNFEDW